MKVNLKDNIFIEGFDEEHEFRTRLYGTKGIYNSITLLYQGKTSEIPEEIAEQILDKDDYWNKKECSCGERDTCYYCNTHYEKSELDIIKELCNNLYCIIYIV